MTIDKRKQVADQCRVVAHLAMALHEVYSDRAKIFASDDTGPNDIIEWSGRRSASLMEQLGEILNGMDAASEDDDWTAPIFRKAQELWPVTPLFSQQQVDASGGTCSGGEGNA